MTGEAAAMYLSMMEAEDIRRGFCPIPRCDRCRRSNADLARETGVGGIISMRDGSTSCVQCEKAA